MHSDLSCLIVLGTATEMRLSGRRRVTSRQRDMGEIDTFTPWRRYSDRHCLAAGANHGPPQAAHPAVPRCKPAEGEPAARGAAREPHICARGSRELSAQLPHQLLAATGRRRRRSCRVCHPGDSPLGRQFLLVPVMLLHLLPVHTVLRLAEW